MIVMVIVSTKKTNTIARKKTNTIARKKTNTIATNVTSAASKFKSKRLLDFAHSFISVYVIIDNYYYLLLLCKSKRYKAKWKIIKLKTFVLKIVRVIISMT